MTASVCTSTDDSGSSRTSTGGDPNTARARASRWRWPPESVYPCSPTRVSSPHGRSHTKPACATSIARFSSWSDTMGRPITRFSCTEAEKRIGSSNANPMCDRSERSRISRTSIPSSRTLPSVTSYRRGTRYESDVLPLPVRPTSPTVSPGSTTRLRSRRIHASDFGYLNPTPRNSRRPRLCSSGRARGWSAISGCESSTSLSRCDAVWHSSLIDSTHPMASIGQISMKT